MSYEIDDHLDEDDAVLRPARRGLGDVEAEDIAAQPARRRLTGPTQAALDSNHEFVLMRKEGAQAVRFSLKHAEIYQKLWKLWAEKRVAGAEDPGVTIGEITEALAGTHPNTTIAAILPAFVRNGLATSVTQFTGIGTTRARYYPSEEGVQAFALAAHLGYGAMVQVGRSPTAWANRKDTEPSNLFQHAALLSRVAP